MNGPRLRRRASSRFAGALGALLVLGVMLWPVPASAHASMVSSSPEQDEQLANAPTTVSFEFSAPMSDPAYVVVTAPDGNPVVVGDPVVDGNIVSQELQPGGPEGSWTAAVRAVSEDGHPITGQITFSVGEDSDGGAAADSGTDGTDGSAETATGPAGEGADDPPGSSADEPRWTRGRTDLAVGVGLFALAGVCLLLARRAPAAQRRTTPADHTVTAPPD